MTSKFINWAVLTLSGCMYLSPGIGQTLFTYGNKSASTQSFLNTFNKNPGEGNRKELMEGYLPLFINYVLKVQDAYDNRLDTLPAHLQEMQEYKIQLAESFIAEMSGSERLIDQKLERLQSDILLGHIFIGYQNKDTASALSKAQEAIKRLQKGEKWETVALAFSTDPDVKMHKGEVGWITAFSIPGPYEDLVYALPQRGYTAPVIASEGVHIFSRLNQRKGAGTVQVAQILISKYEGLSEKELQKRADLADSIYLLLRKGFSFESLVTQYSEDRTSKYSNGVIAPFGPSVYDPEFEKKAFSLKEPGEISKPFQTSFGWHILKLIAKNPPPEKTDTDARLMVRNRLLNDCLFGTSRTQYIKNKMPAMKYRAGNYQRKQLQQFTDSLLTGGNTAVSGLNDKTVLFYFDKTPVSMSDWIAYIRVQAIAGKIKPSDNINNIYNSFIESKASDILPSMLDEIEPEFAAQFKEFKDANLLFEAMERRVWGPSQTDSTALKKFYDSNTKKYIWDENVLAVLTTVNDSLVAREIKKMLDKDFADWRKISEDFSGLAFLDSGRFEIKVLQAAGHQLFEPGQCSDIVSNPIEGIFSLLCVISKGAAGSVRSFEEARGLVVDDYQQLLEDNWVNGLKKKYPVRINEAEWRKLLSQSN